MSNPNPSPHTRFQPGNTLGGKRKQRITRVDEILEKLKLNPTEEVVKLLPELSPKERCHAWLELLSYCQAKPKPVETDKDNLGDLTDDELADLGQSAVDTLRQRKAS